MIPLITQNRKEIAALCRQFGIRKLELFGSATGPDFDEARSDLDFIVDVGEYERGVAKRFFRFALLWRRFLVDRSMSSPTGKSRTPTFVHPSMPPGW